MRYVICLTASLALCATSQAALAKAKPMKAEFQLNETSWTYVDPDKKVKARESIDASGNYIENAVSGKHIDHGTGVMKDGKACFTSAMNSNGEECWTVHAVAIGHSMMTTSDKGHKLTVTRVKYTPMSMPK
ncbi:MAG TPA: hypothetical protein VF098_00390 [Sphingomicrobium sp.]